MTRGPLGCMSMPEKKDSIFDAPEPDVAEDETPVEEAVVADDAPEEVPVPTVSVRLAEDYDGEEPVFVSTGQEDEGGLTRVEVTKSGVEIPYTQVENVTALPYVEVAD